MGRPSASNGFVALQLSASSLLICKSLEKQSQLTVHAVHEGDFVVGDAVSVLGGEWCMPPPIKA